MRKVAVSIPLNISGANLISESDYAYDALHRHEPTVTGTATRSAMYDYGPESSEMTQGADAIGGLLAAYFNGTTAGETGLYYYGYRFYFPEVGRWCSRDPIEEIGSQSYYSIFFGNAVIQDVLFNSIPVNPYDYVDNGPIGWVDVNGLFKWYGNWGGPNWTGGKKGSWPVDNPAPPIDNQDKCYQTHDICYGTCRSAHPCDDCKEKGHKPDNKKRSDCFRDCDRALSECLQKLINSKDPSANWKAKVAAKYFANSNPGPDC